MCRDDGAGDDHDDDDDDDNDDDEDDDADDDVDGDDDDDDWIPATVNPMPACDCFSYSSLIVWRQSEHATHFR